MKAALFSSVSYQGPTPTGVWPVPKNTYQAELAEQSMQNALEQFQMADELGFDWVTVAEHHYAPFSLTPNPMVMAGALTQRVKRAKIALLGSSVPINNPVRVAEEFAMLDTMTGGRVIAGMLRGTSNEYVTYGIHPAESRERFEEALQLIVKAWTETQPFGWLGRYYEYRSVAIWPKPVQAPHPPIYMSGSSPEGAEWAARKRISLGFAVTTVPLAKRSVEIYNRVASEEGWQPTPDDVLYRVGIYVAPTDDEAFGDLSARPQRRASFSTSNRAVDEEAAKDGYYGRDAANQRGRLQAGDLQDTIRQGSLLAGSPETVIQQIQSIHDELGAGILDLTFAGPSRDKVLRSIELFGTQVLPRIHDIQ